MSEQMTGITLRGLSSNAGIADYGLKTVPYMVAQIRARARLMRADADAIMAAADEDFHVDTYVGPLVMRDRRVLQEGKP